ncbi:hypothethical protein [Ralstonia solanacearum PSI07]|uniref:Uncharacterized protein n=1 Tax=blood disease bacterium R229 TaxID=741978 RepID=G2ZNK5_9RALS|nr:hypothethical protein [Ralstonia solanacearum PSI07]CCA80618.1 conserved hypothetical protein [blood disease bacterium R229]
MQIACSAAKRDLDLLAVHAAWSGS